ncbi:hypothetical protein QFC20_001357 [Naganishia adeliensis]|uniref:Uncharacterized protein n=1 Tax=Naganishia adeliensis TaxID=92952 RepID=A0ACC2WTI3_9TREE|nr:hypothetical protein QFC20_001357 [Naganishia adeliensis]
MPTQAEHDDQAAIIYSGSGRAGSLFSAARTEESEKSDADKVSSTEVKVPTCAPPPRVPTPVQQTISIKESFSDALDFMALDPETAFSPQHAKQKVMRKWLLHLHDNILESVKDLNDRRLPLRYPGPSDPVKEARDAMIHAEKLLSSGIIYRLPSNTKEEGSAKPERYNFMYHLMDRQPTFLKNMLYLSFMLSQGMNMYRRRAPEGKPIHKTDGTLRTITKLAEQVQGAAKGIELEKEHQLLALCAMVSKEAEEKGIKLRPSSPHAIRCALEQAKIVGAMKTDVMFGVLDSYLMRIDRCDVASDGVEEGPNRGYL